MHLLENPHYADIVCIRTPIGSIIMQSAGEYLCFLLNQSRSWSLTGNVYLF